MKKGVSEGPRDLGLIGGLIGGPLLLLAALLTPIWLPITMGVTWLSEKAFIQQMKRRGRYMEWPEAAKRLSKGEGTAILDHINKLPTRLWWTEDNVAELSPHPLPEEDDLPFLPVPDLPPFVGWCYAHYLDPENGRAFLTLPPPLEFPNEAMASTDRLRQKFPGARACVTQRTV